MPHMGKKLPKKLPGARKSSVASTAAQEAGTSKLPAFMKKKGKAPPAEYSGGGY